LKAYKDEHGHINVKREEDQSLSDFCRNIRHARKHFGKSGLMKLTADRIAELDAVGFDWAQTDRRSGGLEERRIEDPMLYTSNHGHPNAKRSDDDKRSPDDRSCEEFDLNLARAEQERTRVVTSAVLLEPQPGCPPPFFAQYHPSMAQTAKLNMVHQPLMQLEYEQETTRAVPAGREQQPGCPQPLFTQYHQSMTQTAKYNMVHQPMVKQEFEYI